MSYVEAVRAWFYPKAFVPDYYAMGRYPDEQATEQFKDHVKACELRWASEPDFGTVDGFAGTFAGDEKVKGVRALVGCGCDEYESGNEATLFIPGEMSLAEVITQVVEASGETDG